MSSPSLPSSSPPLPRSGNAKSDKDAKSRNDADHALLDANLAQVRETHATTAKHWGSYATSALVCCLVSMYFFTQIKFLDLMDNLLVYATTSIMTLIFLMQSYKHLTSLRQMRLERDRDNVVDEQHARHVAEFYNVAPDPTAATATTATTTVTPKRRMPLPEIMEAERKAQVTNTIFEAAAYSILWINTIFVVSFLLLSLVFLRTLPIVFQYVLSVAGSAVGLWTLASFAASKKETSTAL